MRKVFSLPPFRFRNEYFLFLLPLFVVFHGYNEYYGKIQAGEALLLLLQYELLLVGLALLFFHFLRSFRKAALFSFFLGCFYFFFGAGHDWLKEHAASTVLVKYSMILPAAVLGFTGLYIYLRKTAKPFGRLLKYLNLLFWCLVGVEAITLPFKKIPHQDIIQRATRDNPTRSDLTPCDTCRKEDIHLIILDEYAGAAELREVFHFDNTPFLDSLRARGFRVVEQSRSNYNFSPISMASMFSLDYLPGVGRWPDYELVDVGSPIIKDNIFMDFLARQGYAINNISIFDVQQQPAYIKEFRYDASLISGHTFLHRLRKDIGYHLITDLKWDWLIRENVRQLEREVGKNTRRMETAVTRVTAGRGRQPQFYYTHLMMPHEPFVLDRYGRSVGLDYYRDPDRERGIKRGYLEYLQYCNKKVLQFIDLLVRQSPRPPVIILMSDHGFRHPSVAERYHFMTLNAVFLPDRRYEGFYEGMSNVNQLRALLNNRFGQHLPMLKDTSIFLGWPDRQ